MATRGSYAYNSIYGKIWKGGGIPKIFLQNLRGILKISFLQFSQKILLVSDKMVHKAFRTRAILWTKPIREIFHYQYLLQLFNYK